MNFYPHHISDFNNATRHLTRVERSVYRDAIELYYDSESVLTSDFDQLAKKLICRSEEEKTALKDVLSEFFDLHHDGYFHQRCDEEIAKYQANTSAKARAGIASAKARKQKAAERKQNSTRVKSSSTPVHNQEPITNNQEPINKTIDRSTLDHHFEQFWIAGMVKTGKKKCQPIFDKLLKNLSTETPEDFTAKLVADVATRLQSNQLGFESMHPSTYLNGERWNDEIKTSTTKNNLFDRYKNQDWAAGIADQKTEVINP